jgi:broad specificity phosphatase PhoE
MAVGLTIPWGVEAITLVRHAQSKANTRELVSMQFGDHLIPLTEEGEKQARAVGKRLATFVRDAYYRPLLYCSPYLRTRQTMKLLLEGADSEKVDDGVFGTIQPERRVVYEDPRLREVDHGYGTLEDYMRQRPLREKHGWFYYRFEDGESPADCYDRVSGFVDSMWRQAERKQARRILIVSHGLTIRCLVMRFLHLSVEAFDAMASPENASVIEIVPNNEEESEGVVFRRGSWMVRGIGLRPPEEPVKPIRLADAPSMTVTIPPQGPVMETFTGRVAGDLVIPDEDQRVPRGPTKPREHCFDVHGVWTSTGSTTNWEEKCCQCGDTRAITQSLERDPSHGPHVDVTRNGPKKVTRPPKSDVCVPVPLPAGEIKSFIAGTSRS